MVVDEEVETSMSERNVSVRSITPVTETVSAEALVVSETMTAEALVMSETMTAEAVVVSETMTAEAVAAAEPSSSLTSEPSPKSTSSEAGNLWLWQGCGEGHGERLWYREGRAQTQHPDEHDGYYELQETKGIMRDTGMRNSLTVHFLHLTIFSIHTFKVDLCNLINRAFMDNRENEKRIRSKRERRK